MRTEPDPGAPLHVRASRSWRMDTCAFKDGATPGQILYTDMHVHDVHMHVHLLR